MFSSRGDPQTSEQGTSNKANDIFTTATPEKSSREVHMLPYDRGPMTSGKRRYGLVVLVASITASMASAANSAEPATDRQIICQTIAQAATADGLPVGFLARLLWIESGFRSSATSPAGAMGVAQFMPGTAARLGVADPRDPMEAIGRSARFLAALRSQFGNLGLAAAAYNAGEARVSAWLRGHTQLPLETRQYVLDVTGWRIEDWALPPGSTSGAYDAAFTATDCANFGVRQAHRATVPRWPEQLESRLAIALDAFRESTEQNAATSTALPHPAARRGANALCAVIRASGASCQVYTP